MVPQGHLVIVCVLGTDSGMYVSVLGGECWASAATDLHRLVIEGSADSRKRAPSLTWEARTVAGEGITERCGGRRGGGCIYSPGHNQNPGEGPISLPGYLGVDDVVLTAPTCGPASP
jgi:hypothetical protein